MPGSLSSGPCLIAALSPFLASLPVQWRQGQGPVPLPAASRSSLGTILQDFRFLIRKPMSGRTTPLNLNSVRLSVQPLQQSVPVAWAGGKQALQTTRGKNWAKWARNCTSGPCKAPSTSLQGLDSPGGKKSVQCHCP